MDTIVNITKIVFDDKLKSFISEIKAGMSNEIDYLSELGSASIHPQDNQAGQHYFRNYFKENKSSLNYINNKTQLSKQDMFALFTCLVIDIDKLTVWEDVFNTANIDDVSGNRPDEEDNRKFEFTCVCGQQIMDICKLECPITTRSIVVGYCCVRKNLISNTQA